MSVQMYNLEEVVRLFAEMVELRVDPDQVRAA